MEAFDTIQGDHPNTLEARIKGFGRLVRSGAIVLIGDGTFAMAETERDDFEELIADPAAQLGRIFRFLGLEPPADLDPSKYHTNESAKRRSNRLHKAAFKFSLAATFDAGATASSKSKMIPSAGRLRAFSTALAFDAGM